MSHNQHIIYMKWVTTQEIKFAYVSMNGKPTAFITGLSHKMVKTILLKTRFLIYKILKKWSILKH